MPRSATPSPPSPCLDRRVVSPTPRAALLTAILGLAVFVVSPPVVVLAELALLMMVSVDALAARRPPAVQRRVASDVACGVPTAFSVSVTGRPGVAVLVRQPQVPGIVLEPSEAVGGIDGRLVALRRGRHELSPVVVRATGPLGLGRWDHDVGPAVEIRSHPDLPGARRLATAVRRGQFRDPGLRRGDLGLGTDFESVREYTPDDDVRRINWLATERTGRPMTNQYREDTEREVWCLIDTGRLMTSPVGDRTRLDIALDAVAAVAAVADVVGDRVGALAFDATIRRQAKPRRAGGAGLLRLLYDLEPEPVDSDYELAFHSVASAKRGLVIVCTDVLEEAASRSLLEAAPVLARHHAVLIATVSDPDLVRTMAAEPAGPVEVHAAAVATGLLADRDRTVAMLRRCGALVVDTVPDRFASACVAAYLTLKSRARL